MSEAKERQLRRYQAEMDSWSTMSDGWLSVLVERCLDFV